MEIQSTIVSIPEQTTEMHEPHVLELFFGHLELPFDGGNVSSPHFRPIFQLELKIGQSRMFQWSERVSLIEGFETCD